MPDVNANIVIKANTDQAVKGLKSVQAATKDLEKQSGLLKSTFAQVTAGFLAANVVEKAGRMLLDFGRQSVFAADALQALNSRAGVIYKETLPGVTAELAKFSAQTGRADDDLLSFAASFAGIAQGFSIPKQAAADMSVELAKLTTDFGSFFHVADDEAFSMVQGGLLGMGRSLQRYGIVLNDATLAEYAHAQGITQKVAEMNEAQQVALRYNFLLDKTAEIQGDATRNAHSFSNELKNLQGAWEDFQQEAGTPVLGVLAAGFGGIADVIRSVRLEIGYLKQDLAGLTGGSMLGAAFGGLKGGSGTWGSMLGAAGFGAPSPKGNGFGYTDLNGPGFAKAGPADRSAGLKAQLAQYAGLGSPGGGGGGAGKAADELEKSAKAVADAFADQANRIKDAVTARREELKLRERLGTLTKDETRELEKINGRLQFKKDLVDEATKAWEEQADAVKRTQERVKDLTDQIADEQRKLKDSLKDIDKDFGRKRTDTVADMLTEKAELEAKLTYGDRTLSGSEGDRLAQLTRALGSASPEELLAGGGQNALDPLQRLEQEKQRRIADATEQSNARLAELQQSLEAEKKKLEAVKAAEAEKNAAVASALNDRVLATQAALALELQAVRDNVTAQIAEYNRLRPVGNSKLLPGNAPGLPGFADGGRPPVGRASIIGENGPEVWVPDSAGTVVPLTGRNAGGAISINIQSFVVHKDADPDAMMRTLAREIQKQMQGAA